MIDITPDYAGFFNAGDGDSSSFPDEVRFHSRSAEILAIEKALGVWANWFDTNDPQGHPGRYFPWQSFYRTGYCLAKELSEILGEGYEVKYYHTPIAECEETLEEAKPEDDRRGVVVLRVVGVLLLVIVALAIKGLISFF